MKVTIDSSEPLRDALRVIGALYDVQLAVTESAVVATPTPTAGRRKSASAAKPTQSRRASKAATSNRTKSTTLPTTPELRSWARLNGRQVSDRGRVPAAIVAAYQEAHTG